MYINNTIKEYLDDLAARKPAPGGGSAAALAGATGIALISMVCNFSVGKKRYKEFEPDLKKILSKAESLRERLAELIDKDVEAYKKFTSSSRDDNALRQTLSVPLEVCRLAHEALKLCPELVEKGNTSLVSDVGCAAELLEGAFLSALLNVEINLSCIKDRAFIIEINRIIEPMRKEVSAVRGTVTENVAQRMKIK